MISHSTPLHSTLSLFFSGITPRQAQDPFKSLKIFLQTLILLPFSCFNFQLQLKKQEERERQLLCMRLVDYDTDTEDPLISKKDSWVKTPGEVNPGETMTVGGVTRKVISMEKAMQRELSFKTKLELLQKKTQTGLQKPSSIQGVNASTKNRGVLGKAPPENISSPLPRYAGESNFQRPPEKREQGVTATAKTRNTGVQGKAPLENISRPLPQYAGESHFQRNPEKREQGVTATASTRNTGLQGNTQRADNSHLLPKHTEKSYFQRTPEKKEQEVIRAGVKRKDPPSNQSCPPPQHAGQLYLTQTPEQCENTNYKCKECDIICTGFVNLHDHYQGRKHKTRVEELRIQNGVAPMEARQLVYKIQDSPERCVGGLNVRTAPVSIPQGPEPVRKCEICNCICPGLANYNQHMKGKKHKARLEQLKVGKDVVCGGTEPINCEICKIVCMNEFAYKQHQAGKKHAVALQAIRSLNTSIL